MYISDRVIVYFRCSLLILVFDFFDRMLLLFLFNYLSSTRLQYSLRVPSWMHTVYDIAIFVLLLFFFPAVFIGYYYLQCLSMILSS